MSGDFGLGSWPGRRARIDADRVALRQAGRQLTYGELARRVDRLAAALRDLGVRPAARVAWLGANDIATFELFFATAALGAIFVPLNTRLAAPEIAVMLADCRPTVLVHDAEAARTVAGADPAAHGVEQVLAAASLDGLTAAATTPLATADVGLDDPAVILYTSGTTGRPKGAVLSHGNLTFNTMNQLAHADVLSTDVALCMSPLFHATGLGQVSLPTLFKGGTVLVVPRFDAARVLQTIAEARVSSFSAVPTMLQLLAEHPDFAAAELSSLRYVNYGGSAVLEQVALAWQARGVLLLQGYGMTEASPGVLMAVAGGVLERPTSAGVPHFFTDIALDPGNDAAADIAQTADPIAGRQGELLVRGLNVFGRYWDRPDDTKRAFRDGWYRSGDVVRFDGAGWGYVVDRVKDMIISGGENVYPAEVEAVLAELPGIRDSAVIAVPDERWGEVGLAFLVTDAAASWTPASLREALTGRLASYKIPKHVRVVAELPRTATGKIRRETLRTAAHARGR